MSLLSLLGFGLGSAVRDLRRAGSAALAGILLVALATLLVGGVVLGLRVLARQTAAWRAELRLVAILHGEVGAADGAGGEHPVVAAARALPGAAAVRYVSASAALAELRGYLGPAGAGLDRLPVNPVPARLEVTPAGALDAARLGLLVAALGRLPGVEEVQAATAWVGRVERVERLLRVAGLGLGAALGLGAVLAIAGATAVARERRADEAAVLSLAGVPWIRVQGPLLLGAVVQGGAGAALGWSALLVATEVGAPWTGPWLSSTVGLAPLPAPEWALVGGLVGAGATAGLLGGLAGGWR